MNKELTGEGAWGIGIVALALVGTIAFQLGYIDGDALIRTVAINGVMIAWYGNRMPKKFEPTAAAQRAARFGGWSMVISGLIYAMLWAFAPIMVAFAGGCSAVIAGIVATTLYRHSLQTQVSA
ncbi:ammonium transporter [Sphingomonas sp. AOB5]|uniref:ammonium transporter n=1 Tax=Sphingomonas sp. AOB5 TaxID=3034017 RepID=UPI0023F8DBA6|nr:ammonium transporter [Sphingomonas sp. AOB5]MDF7777011.1 ammonium transporter [Sphingomonas sp. AOB5]